MSLTTEQTDAAMRETFYNMEEGVEYVLNDFWFQEANRLRKEWTYSLMKNKQEYRFSREGDRLFVNNNFVFDFAGKHNIPLTLTFTYYLASAIAFPFPFTLTLAHILQYNGIEKLKPDTCEGKVVEIDGKKYKLTAV